MKTLKVGEITITSLIERDGPWRTPEAMFPAYDAAIGRKHLAELDPVLFDSASGRMVITYQTFLVRTPKHTILIDTCTGEDKGYPAPYDFTKQPWLDDLHAAGLGVNDITHVFCTHLHFDHTGWNTMLRNGRWTPAFPNAKYIFHKDEYAQWEATTARGETPPGIMQGACPVTPGATIAGRSSRRDRRCWSTTRLNSTTISRSFPLPAIHPAIVAS